MKYLGEATSTSQAHKNIVATILIETGLLLKREVALFAESVCSLILAFNLCKDSRLQGAKPCVGNFPYMQGLTPSTAATKRLG